MAAFITTFSGLKFDFNDPKPDQVVLTDIVYALAFTNRWGGHARPAISVAQHSVLVAERLGKVGASPMVQLQGLFHDAAEAYLGDIPTPIKAFMVQYQAMEILVEATIFEAFGIAYPMDPIVHLIDVEIRNWEYRDRMVGNALPPPVGNPPTLPLWTPAQTQERFIELYCDLVRAIDRQAA